MPHTLRLYNAIPTSLRYDAVKPNLDCDNGYDDDLYDDTDFERTGS